MNPLSEADVYRGYEALLGLPDKERGGADLLGWDPRRMRRWLGRLGDPQLQLRCTLVAGSKGKGSTAAMLEAMLRAAGRRTGLYAQPHLHRYAERIRVDGRPLTPPASRAALDHVLGLAPGPVTAFEAATAAALWVFARSRVQDAVLEVGFGGRLDAVAEADPAVVLMASLESEHVDLLGPTLADVAAHDLALCRYGRVCWSVPQPPPVDRWWADRLRAQAVDGGVVSPPEVLVGGRVRLRTPAGAVDAGLRLHGAFQRVNAALAAAGAASLGVGPGAMAGGLEAVSWPGRFECVSDRPLVVVDGAHTPASAQALAAAVHSLVGPRGRVALVAGMLSDKDAVGFASALRVLCARTVTVAPRHPRALDADVLARAFGSGAEPAPDLEAAMALARAWAGADGLVLVAGSLHLAAEARLVCGQSACV